MTGMDIAASPKRRLWLCVPTLQMHSQNGSGDLHILTCSSPTARSRTTTCVTATQERHRQWVRPLKEPVLPVPVNESTSSRSLQLMGGIPMVPETQERAMEQEMPRMNAARPRR